MQVSSNCFTSTLVVYIFFGVSVFASLPAIYSTLKILIQGSEGYEPLNPPATGNPVILQRYTKKRVKVIVTISSYNDTSIYSVLSKWLSQNYPDYNVVVLEDGSLSYDKYGDVSRFSYEYVSPNGKLLKVLLEKISLKSRGYSLGSFIVVRRDSRDGYKAGAYNNLVELIDKAVLEEAYGIDRPDYMVAVDADHEPGRNPWLRLLLGKTLYKTELSSSEYEKLKKILISYEETGRELLDIEEYELDPRVMDDSSSFITRAVELMEFHKPLIPRLAVIQGYQNHIGGKDGVLDLLVYSSHVLSQYAMITRSPIIRVEVTRGNDKSTRMVHETSRGLFKKLIYRKWIISNEVVRGDKSYRVYVSEHAMPLFTGSGAILDYDVVSKYKFSDGVFTDHSSLTEDWEFSVRITKDKHLILATHQIETIAKPPRDISTYRRQQFRWAYGTVSDIKRRYREVMDSREITRLTKLSYLIQGSYYFPNAVWVYGLLPVSILLAYTSSNISMSYLTAITALYVLYGDISPHLRVVPGIRNKLKLLGGVLLNNVILTPVLAKACYKALKGEKVDWVVTLKAN